MLFTLGTTLTLYSALEDYYYTLNVQAQAQPLQPAPIIGIKITSPTIGQQVPVGELTISGTSTDNATSDCTVYADWNNTKPFQTAVATGPGGVNDYSTWTFTYTDDYHLITNGTNDLTSKLSCVGDDSNVGTANITKSYSVNVIGVATTTSTNNTAGVTSTEEVQQQQQQPQSPTIDSNITTTNENNTAAAAEATPPGLSPSVSTLSPVPLPPSIEEEQEPPPALKPEDDQDSTIYWDIE